jgi:uncharacterized ferritin-like protein (DUF455 family)
MRMEEKAINGRTEMETETKTETGRRMQVVKRVEEVRGYDAV